MPQRMDVLRWGYRLGRDPRITTHLGLVARALGATGFLLTGDRDDDLFDNLQSVCQRFGGELETTHVPGLKHLKNHVQNVINELSNDVSYINALDYLKHCHCYTNNKLTS